MSDKGQNQPHLRIATRGSTLALWQARFVASRLESLGYPCELIIIKTTGDKVQDRFLHEIGGKGLFIKELEEALLRREADLAIHSLKDLPARLDPDFVLAAYLERHSARDLFIAPLDRPKFPHHKGLLSKEDFASLPDQAVIATGSLRRAQLIKMIKPTFKVEGIRGNVDTRLRKLVENQGWTGLVLAEAALDRLGLKEQYQTYAIDPDWFIPAPAQGVLAIETLSDSPLKQVLHQLNSEETAKCAELERHVLSILGGDCNLPFGCYARFQGHKIHIKTVVFSDKDQAISSTLDLRSESPSPVLAQQVVDDLVRQDTQHGFILGLLQKAKLK